MFFYPCRGYYDFSQMLGNAVKENGLLVVFPGYRFGYTRFVGIYVTGGRMFSDPIKYIYS